MAEKLSNRQRGRMGGLAKVPKGLAKLSPERRKEISAKGVETRNANRSKRQSQSS